MVGKLVGWETALMTPGKYQCSSEGWQFSVGMSSPICTPLKYPEYSVMDSSKNFGTSSSSVSIFVGTCNSL